MIQLVCHWANAVQYVYHPSDPEGHHLPGDRECNRIRRKLNVKLFGREVI
jgi:hypothetical protein